MLNRYIQKCFWSFALKAMSVLSLFNFLLDWIKEQKSVGQHNYTFLKSCWYSLCILPARWVHIGPIIGILTIAGVVYTLHAKGELKALYGLGLKPIKLLYFMVVFGVSWHVLLFVNDDVASALESKAKVERMNWLNNGQTLNQDGYYWVVDHVDQFDDLIQIEVTGNDSISQMMRYRFEDNVLSYVDQVGSAHLQSEGFWQLNDITRVQMKDGFTTQTFEHLEWHTNIDIKLLLLSKQNASLLTLRHLYQLMNNTMIGLPVQQFSSTFWARLFAPINGTIIMWLMSLFALVYVHRVPTVFYFLGIIIIGVTLLQGSLWGYYNIFQALQSWPNSLLLVSGVMVAITMMVQKCFKRWLE